MEIDGNKYLAVDSESVLLINGAEIDYEDEMARTGYVVSFFNGGMLLIKID